MANADRHTTWGSDSNVAELGAPVLATLHVLAAFGAGIAAMELMRALAFGHGPAAALFVSVLAVTLVATFAEPRPPRDARLFGAAAVAEAVAWMALTLQVQGPVMLVGIGMAAASLAIPRHVLLERSAASRLRHAEPAPAAAPAPAAGWIEDIAG